jgi:hypothetical protein
MSQTYGLAFDATRRAIARIQDSSLQRDLAALVVGIEFGHAQENPTLDLAVCHDPAPDNHAHMPIEGQNALAKWEKLAWAATVRLYTAR